jgi:hypothetical protein
MKISRYFFVYFFMAAPAVAELAPFYQSVKEIKSILEADVLETLNPNAINKIDRETSPDGGVLYSITTASCTMVFQITSPDSFQITSPDSLGAPEPEEEPKHSNNTLGHLGPKEFSTVLKSNSCD